MARASKKAKRPPHRFSNLPKRPREEPVREPLKALNKRQAEYIRAILKGDQVFTLGPAGTGKTFIAATVAADLLLEGKIEKIVLTRPAIGVDEEHGFLPGDIGRKIAPWVVPFTEVMQKRLGKDRFRQAMSEGQIEIAPIAYMRGRTFDRALIFLDEAQNTTYSQIKMFLTRIGEGSKVIVNGDIRQTDLKLEDEGSCGLAAVLAMVEHLDLPVPVIEFTNEDVVRSGICKLWAEAFTDFEDAVEAGLDQPSMGFTASV